MNTVEHIVCADWGKKPAKRAVYEVHVEKRAVRRVPLPEPTVESVLAHVEGRRRTIVAFDAPIGLPASFLSAVHPGLGFVEWLEGASLAQCSRASDWCVEAPFFRVPAGPGSLNGFVEAARRSGVMLRRDIEVRTGAKPVFVVAGIPGSVGSAALDLWEGLRKARAAGHLFSLWPFEGNLGEVLDSGWPVVAEIYPRAAYATAILDASPRPRLKIAKTQRPARTRAIETLRKTRWVTDNAVCLQDLDAALHNEDDFDALMTASALLRCVLEGLPLASDPGDGAATEGGILATGAVDLSLPEMFRHD